MNPYQLTEREFSDAVVKLARLSGWRCIHHRPALNRSGRWSTAMQGDKGWVDLVLVRPPDALFVETKTDKGRLTPEQKEWLADLEACGLRAEVWRPAMWGHIETVLTGRAA